MRKKLSIVIVLLLLLLAMIAVAIYYNRDKVEAHRHAYGEWNMTTVATCTLDGTRERKCKGCARHETETLDKIAHAPAADDNDCTTAVTCTICAEITTAEQQHIVSDGWKSDGTGHWNECTNVGCNQVAVAKTAHTLSADDNDCATPVKCTVCEETTTAATTHTAATAWESDGADHWYECTNDGCNQIAVAKTAHTLLAGNDCTIAATCTECLAETTAAKAHALGDNWEFEGDQHWNECTNIGCDKNAVEKTDHTLPADDKNCTTEDKCSTCSKVTTAAKVHVGGDWIPDENNHWKECTNDGCDKNFIDKTAHTLLAGNDCTIAATCTECLAETTAAKAHALGDNWEFEGDQHWKMCGNSGCDEIAVAKAAHTPGVDDNNCATPVTCTVCEEITTAATTHTAATEWSKDGSYHWMECGRSYCNVITEQRRAHRADTDDNNCSTEAKCGTCLGVAAAAKEHAPLEVWKSDDDGHWNACGNDGCTQAARPKTQHAPGAKPDNCTISIRCVECQFVTTTGKAQHAESGIYESDDEGHWQACTNDGCVSETQKYNHSTTEAVCVCGYVDYNIFSIYEGVLTRCIPGQVTKITLPSSVTSISNGAFYGCTSLTSITIPSSVTSIGKGAFSSCSGLTSLVVAPGNTTYSSNGNCIIETATKTLIAGCTTSIIPTDGSVTSIGERAFASCTGLTSITIPDTVTSIVDSAFSGCTSLTSITIPSSVTSIGDYAFSGCSALINATISEGVTSIGNYAFSDCSALTNVTIPDTVTSIGNLAFSDCSALTRITIPGSVKSIGNGAFDGCTSLTSLTISEGVTSIGDSAFYNCTSLRNLIIPSSVTSIGEFAFYECVDLTIRPVATEQPDGWHKDWRGNDCMVLWGKG